MTIVNPDLGKSFVVSDPPPLKEMISITQLADGRRRVRMNSSSLSVIQECMRKAKYSLLEKWRSADESPATCFGSAMHKALEIYYTGPMAGRYVPELEQMEMMALGHGPDVDPDDFVLRSFAGFLDKARPLEPLPETDKRSLKNGAWILHHYFKTFKDDPYVAYVDERGPFIERTFSLVIHEDSELILEVFGTIDFAWRHVKTGEIIVGDHKTTSSLGWGDQSYFDREKPNLQYSCYVMGAQEVFGLKSEDFLVNVLEVKAKPKTAKGYPPSFPRQVTRRTPDDIDEFKETALYFARTYVNATKTKIWPMGPVGSCTAYGSCSFRAVCSAPKSLRETLLQNKFERSQCV